MKHFSQQQTSNRFLAGLRLSGKLEAILATTDGTIFDLCCLGGPGDPTAQRWQRLIIWPSTPKGG